MASWLPSLITAVSVVAVALIEARASKDRKNEKESREKAENALLRTVAVEDGVLALLRDRVIERYNHYTEQGYIPIYGMDNVNKMYSAYHALGGNGTITKLVEELDDLPTDPPN